MRQCQIRPDLLLSGSSQCSNIGVTNSVALYSSSVTLSANLEYSAKLYASSSATHEAPSGNGAPSVAAHRARGAGLVGVSGMGAQEPALYRAVAARPDAIRMKCV
jgi:hypothetical protein